MGGDRINAYFQILGTDYVDNTIISKKIDDYFDLFTKMDFVYKNAVATVKIGKGVKSEGEMIISGTKGMFMFLRLGGRLIILKFAMRIKIRISDFFMNLKVRGLSMSSLIFCEQ